MLTIKVPLLLSAPPRLCQHLLLPLTLRLLPPAGGWCAG
jgi:hypothetical protein